MISIVDYKMGNVGSVANMLKHIGEKCNIVSSVDGILNAEKIILPGVGSWDKGIENLENANLVNALNKRVLEDKIPTLGICLGMQLMLEKSEEGVRKGLSWVQGEVKKFHFNGLPSDSKKHRIPHMGWNVVVNLNIDDQLTSQMTNNTRYYFVHSFHASNVADENRLLMCHYGYDFVCGVKKENIWGVQFHPEKSHKYGMQLMKRFVNI